MNKIKKMIGVGMVVFTLGGCSSNIGKYNLVVPQNVNVTHLISDGKVVEKKYCTRFLFGFIPITFASINTSKNTKKTIERFNKQGIEGNALADVSFDNSFLFIPLVITSGCMKVKGTMVTLNKNNPQ
jgi:hypothetical protein